MKYDMHRSGPIFMRDQDIHLRGHLGACIRIYTHMQNINQTPNYVKGKIGDRSALHCTGHSEAGPSKAPDSTQI